MENLLCPHCKTALVPKYKPVKNKENCNILKCMCHEYPVISGIPIIMKGKVYNTNINTNEITSLIKKKQFRKAVMTLLLSGVKNREKSCLWINAIPYANKITRLKQMCKKTALVWRKNRARTFIRKPTSSVTAREMIAFYFDYCGYQNEDAKNYFLYRFGQPRHLVALSLASIMSGSRAILDLACGMGHITRGLCNMHPHNDIIGLDRDFYLLYIAKHKISPSASFICCDLDSGIPLERSCASGILCANSFHFFLNKERCANELTRVVHNGGIIALTALRHSKIKTKTPNTALPPEGYLALFHDRKKSMLSDRKILNRYIEQKGPDLSSKISLSDAEKEDLISIVISDSKNIFKKHGKYNTLPHKYGTLDINPLYRSISANGCDESGIYYLRFPSGFYRKENREMPDYFPNKIKVHRKPSGIKIEVLEGESDFCVLTDMPSGYYYQPSRKIDYRQGLAG